MCFLNVGEDSTSSKGVIEKVGRNSELLPPPRVLESSPFKAHICIAMH